MRFLAGKMGWDFLHCFELRMMQVNERTVCDFQNRSVVNLHFVQSFINHDGSPTVMRVSFSASPIVLPSASLTGSR